MSSIKKRKLDKEAIKVRIIKTAGIAFGQNGIKNVRMDDIAAELSISKRTLYELFGDKEELLLEVLKVHRLSLKKYMTDVVAKADNVLEIIFEYYLKTTQIIQKTNRLFFDDLKRYPKVLEFEKLNRQENMETAIAFYQKGVEQGIFRDDVNFRIVESMVYGQMDVLIHSEYCQDYSLVEILETIIFMHMRGISTEKGLKIVNDFLLKMKKEHKVN